MEPSEAEAQQCLASPSAGNLEVHSYISFMILWNVEETRQ
jgi:hypothetical protein